MFNISIVVSARGNVCRNRNLPIIYDHMTVMHQEVPQRKLNVLIYLSAFKISAKFTHSSSWLPVLSYPIYQGSHP